MARNLIKTGETTLNLLIENLSEICRKHLLSEKWLLAPSLRIGYQWIDSVVRIGQAVVNVHVQTVSGLVIKLSSSKLDVICCKRLKSEEAICLIDRILNASNQPNTGYFADVPRSFSLSERIYYSIRDLRLAGLTHDDLEHGAFESIHKGQEIVRILKSYTEELRNRGLVDYSDEVDLAAQSAREHPQIFANDVLVIIADDSYEALTFKEKAFWGSVPQDRRVRLPIDSPSTAPILQHPTNSQLLRWILEPSKAPDAEEHDQSVSIYSAVGEINEVREVFRRCMSNGIPLDEVEILYTDGHTYIPLIYETALLLQQEHSIDGPIATLDEGIPATYTRPGKALSGWASLNRDGFLQSTLVKLLEADLLPPNSNCTENQRFLALKLLRSIKIGSGLERYRETLETKRKEHDAALSNTGSNGVTDDDEAAARFLFQAVEKLTSSAVLTASQVTNVDDDESSKAHQLDILEKAISFLQAFGKFDTELDRAANEALVARLGEMKSMAERWGSLSINMLSWVENLFREVRINPCGPEPGAIYVTGLENGGHSGRKHTFVVGLDDARFPPSGMQDPVLLDSEREKLSGSTAQIPTARGRLSLQLRNFSYLLSRLNGSITLSYSLRSIADDRETFPSPVLLSAYRIISQNRTIDINNLIRSLQPPVSFCPTDPAKCVTIQEWWLNRLCSPGTMVDADLLLGAHFPHFAKGKEAQAARDSAHFTKYDGRIFPTDHALDPMSSHGPRLSVHSLEILGTCPRKYFFECVLGITPVEEVVVDKDVWLSSKEFGTLAHEVFNEFVQQKMNDWPPSQPGDSDMLSAILSKCCEEHSKDHPPPTQAAYDRSMQELSGACSTFLRYASKQNDRQPVFLEATIGLGARNQGSIGSNTIMLDLSNGKRIRIGGRIDRIDKIKETSPPEFVILDYKTGSSYKYTSQDIFGCGRSIQHGVYIHLAESALRERFPDAEVVVFEYFFPGIKEDGLSIKYTRNQLAESMKVIEQLCQIAGNGAFITTDSPKKDCKYCPYTSMCDTDSVQEKRTAVKLGVVEPVLHYMKELRSREPKQSKK